LFRGLFTCDRWKIETFGTEMPHLRRHFPVFTAHLYFTKKKREETTCLDLCAASRL